MSRVHNNVILKWHDLISQRIVHPTSQILNSDVLTLNSKVRSADLTQEQAITSVNGVILAVRVHKQVSSRLRSVTRGMEHSHLDLAKSDLLTILGFVEFEASLSGGTKDNSGTCFSGEFKMSRDKIGMEVSFEYIFNGSASRFGLLNVRISVSKRIDDDGFVARFDVVSEESKAASRDLLNVEILGSSSVNHWNWIYYFFC
mmetsp:Transcript_60034/g.83401  ORF Transcript_60034/g.83401 Transcript_60034/m.83401 type:complete len:201 (+) Transcript_60034:857-1459(+)